MQSKSPDATLRMRKMIWICAFCAYRLTRPRYYRPSLYPMLKYSFWKLEINIPRKIAVIKHNLPRVPEEDEVIFATLVLHWGHTKSLNKAETHILVFCVVVVSLCVTLLTLKMPRKPASENVVCFCRLLNILANCSNLFCTQANSVDPDQTAPRGAVWSGSILFAKMTFKITGRWQGRRQLLWLAV